MRYPVGDDFAIDLAAHLYRGLLEQRRTLPAVLQLALPSVLPAHPRPGVPPLSVATPALFGARAAGLTLTPPAAPSANFAVAPTGLAYFPPEPEHFVGRVGPMARASAAIAPQSGTTGVLFHVWLVPGKPPARWSWRIAMRQDVLPPWSGTKRPMLAVTSRMRCCGWSWIWKSSFLGSK